MNLSEKKKILVVDDDDGHRLMLKAILESQSYDVYEASDGSIALEMLEEQFFDLILLDLKMKKMDGIETLEGIKKNKPRHSSLHYDGICFS